MAEEDTRDETQRQMSAQSSVVGSAWCGWWVLSWSDTVLSHSRAGLVGLWCGLVVWSMVGGCTCDAGQLS